MGTGFSGTFVFSWSQTEIDGLEAAPLASLDVGAAWSWRGDALRVDGPNDRLRLENAEGAEQLRKRASRMVHRLVGQALERDLSSPFPAPDDNEPMLDRYFTVTDGARNYMISLIETGGRSIPLLMFFGTPPPRNTDLWIVKNAAETDRRATQDTLDSDVICFTPGTRLMTPHGPTAIENLHEGDKLATKDNGAQTICWIGSRRMTGARLFAMPELRPIRISPGALGIDHPDQDLLVSPDHRMLLKGAAAQALFNTSEVLVPARDLINGKTISVDLTLREVTYVHVMLEHHQVIWANGVETESFQPANASLSSLSASDRHRLLALYPDLQLDPHSYGNSARRNLTRSEAALLRHAA